MTPPPGLWNGTNDDTTCTRLDDDRRVNDMLERMTLGCHVQVEDRLWPGSNKPGGTARVTAIHRETKEVDLHFVVDSRRKEKHVDMVHLTRLAPEFDFDGSTNSSSTSTGDAIHRGNNLRDRSLQLGRCSHCGSLRADCGSCDWVLATKVQETQGVTAAAAAAAETIGPSSRKRTKRGKSKTSIRRNDKHENCEGKIIDSINAADRTELMPSDDDDEEMEELIQKQQREFKRLKLQKSRQQKELQQYILEQEMETKEALARAKAREQRDTKNTAKRTDTNSPIHQCHLNDDDSSSSSDSDSLYSSSDGDDHDDDDDDDDELVPLAQLALKDVKRKTNCRRLRKFQNKYQALSAKGKRKISKTNDKHRNKRQDNNQHQQDESASTTEEEDSQQQTTTRNNNAAVPAANVQSENNVQQSTTNGPVSDTAVTSRSLNVDEDETLFDNDVDDHDDVGNNDDDTPNYIDNSHDNIDSIHDNINGYHNPEVVEEEPDSVIDETMVESRRPGIHAEMEDFIEPEGLEVAENLPDDTIDRANGVSYTELPAFFDGEASRIQDILLPDAKLKVAQLERQINRWTKGQQQQQQSYQKDELLAACDRAMKDIMANLIRGGVDQCRSALRQLLDDRRYKHERKYLSTLERKEIRRHRGDTLLTARDTRMDTMERDVDELFRKVRNARSNLVMNEDDVEIDDQVGDISSSDGTGDQQSDDDNENRAFGGDENDSDNAPFDMGSTGGNPRPLSPWDPHKYARIVRPPLSEAQEKAKSRKGHEERPRHKKHTVRPKKKRARHNNPPGLGDSPSRDRAARNSRGPGKRKRQDAESTSSDVDETSDHFILQPKRRLPKETAAAPRAARRKQRQPSAPTSHAASNKNTVSSATAPDSSTREYDSDNDINVPMLEDLFATGNRGPSLVNPNERRHGTTGTRHQQPIADRMQAFLDANSGVGDSISNPVDPATQTSDRIRNKRFMRNRGRLLVEVDSNRDPRTLQTDSDRRGGRRSRFDSSRDIFTRQSDSLVVGGSEGTLYSAADSDHLFARLSDKPSIPAEETGGQAEEAIRGNAQDLSALCESLLSTCPSAYPGVFATKLKALTIASTRNTESQDLHSTAVLAFRTVLKLLQNQESPTLQEVMTGFQKWPLHCHIALLTETLNLIGKGVSAHLRPDDNVIFEVFSANPSKRFIGFVVLQLVDSLYSIFHPIAWGNPFHQSPSRGSGGDVHIQLLNALLPLRDALARVSPLGEWVCDCISEAMPCQTWRLAKVSPRQRAFVSAVDPGAWRSLLLDGSDLQRPKDPRMAHFRGVFPRCEASALWSVLAFVAKTPPTAGEICKNSLCWRLASKVTLRGPLCSANKQVQLPPSESQLRCCEQELSFLTELLTAGAAGNAPKDDKNTFKILTSALGLQADDYEMNERSRANAYPVLSGGSYKLERRRLRQMWDKNLDGDFSSTQQQEKVPLKIPTGLVDTQFGQPVLLPSSLLSRQCLNLFVGWIQKVPVKKARFNRLLKEIRALVKEVAAKAKRKSEKIKENESGAESDLFALAFSTTATSADATNRVGSGPERKETFLLECAAYLGIVAAVVVRYTTVSANDASISGSLSLDDAASKAWDTLADDAMKKRRNDNLLPPQRALYRGDEFRLYTASRAITFAALAVMGFPAWNTTFDKLQTPTCLAHGVAPRDDASVHLITSYLITCLDCHCDLQGSKVVMASLCTNISLVFSHAFHVLSSSNPDFKIFWPSVRALARVSIQTFSQTFKRCFHVIMRDALCGDESEICFLAALSALRGAALLTAYAQNETSPPLQETNNRTAVPTATTHPLSPSAEDDLLWGGIDDDAFAQLDLGDFEGNNEEQDANRILFTFLSEALRESKPSKRFAIENNFGQAYNNDTGVNWKMCSQGRDLVSRQRRRICDCLAVLCAKKGSACGRDLGVFLSQTGITDELSYRDDVLYQDDLVHSTSIALCNMSSVIPHCSSFVRSNSELVLSSLVEELLDLKSLEKFPTCNLSRIKQVSGRKGEEHEYLLLKAANNTNGNSMSRPLGSPMWEFCSKFGAALTNDNDDANGGSFEHLLASVLRPDGPTRSCEDDCSGTMPLVSLEKECYMRIKLLVSIISIFSSHGTQKLEKISKIVERSATHILFASKKLSDTEGNQFTLFEAKLTELVTSYCDVHVTLLSWILRMAPGELSADFESLLEAIRMFLAKILHENEENVFASLTELRMLASSAGQRQHQSNPNNVSTINNKGSVKLARILRHSLLRRSRELFLHVSKMPARASGLMDAIVVASIGKTTTSHHSDDFPVADVVASSLSSKAPKPSGDICVSPLQNAVDQYLETTWRIGSTELQRLKELKQNLLVRFLLPRLRYRQASGDTKLQQRIFVFAERIIDFERDTAFSLDDRDLEVNSRMSLRDLARALSQSLRSAFGTQIVGSDLVCSIFSCARALAASRIVSRDNAGGAIGTTVAQWSQSASSRDSMSCEEAELIPSYLWHVFLWIKAVAELILAEDDSTRILDFRLQLLQSDDKSWPLISQELQRYASRLFPEKSTSSKIVNIYAKKAQGNSLAETTGDGNGDYKMEAWKPDASVQRAAKHFLAELIPIC